jgi:predicted permease
VIGLLVDVAFSNVSSLVLMREESRQRELTHRRALGATASTIWRDVLLEKGLLALAGTVLGVVVAALAVQLLVRIAPAGVPRLDEVRIDPSVMGVAALMLASFGLVTTLIGMSGVRGREAMSVLRDAGRTATTSRSAARLRAAFVAVELEKSLALLAGSGVLARSLLRLRHVNPGFEASNVFTFWTFLPGTSYRHDEDAAAFYRTAISRFRGLPGVASVATTAKLPLEIEGYPYRTTGWGDNGTTSTADLPPIVQATSASSSYFETMRIPLIAGRSYDDANVRRGSLEAVASRGYVEQVWHDPTGRSGVGKRIRKSATGPWFTIVGVAGDVRDSTLTLPAVPEVYFPEEWNGDTTGKTTTTARDMAFVVRTRFPTPGIASVLRRELHSLDPNLPFHRPASMDQIVADSRANMTFALMVLGVGAAATLVLGIIGLYGAIAYVVALRAREISIRIAVGLDPALAPRLVLREGASVIVAGSAAGVLVFIAFAQFLGSLTFEVTPRDPAMIALAVGSVFAIAALSMWLAARRTAGLHPADALKAD